MIADASATLQLTYKFILTKFRRDSGILDFEEILLKTWSLEEIEKKIIQQSQKFQKITFYNNPIKKSPERYTREPQWWSAMSLLRVH